MTFNPSEHLMQIKSSQSLFEKSDKSSSRTAVKMYFEHFSNRL